MKPGGHVFMPFLHDRSPSQRTRQLFATQPPLQALGHAPPGATGSCPQVAPPPPGPPPPAVPPVPALPAMPAAPPPVLPALPAIPPAPAEVAPAVPPLVTPPTLEPALAPVPPPPVAPPPLPPAAAPPLDTAPFGQPPHLGPAGRRPRPGPRQGATRHCQRFPRGPPVRLRRPLPFRRSLHPFPRLAGRQYRLT